MRKTIDDFMKENLNNKEGENLRTLLQRRMDEQLAGGISEEQVREAAKKLVR